MPSVFGAITKTRVCSSLPLRPLTLPAKERDLWFTPDLKWFSLGFYIRDFLLLDELPYWTTELHLPYKKTLRGYGVCEKWLLSAKGANIAVKQHKGSLWGSKISNIRYISENMPL